MLLPILLQIAAIAQPAAVPAPIASPAVAEQGAITAAALTVEASTASAPQRLVLFGPPLTPQGSEVRRAADGLFYVMAIVNGAPIKFLVDTGATIVVLTPEDARRAGVAPDETHYSSSAETANGRTAMARVTLNEMIVGTKHTQAIDAAVVQGNLPVSLLGQNWLAQLNSITISGDKLHFQ